MCMLRNCPGLLPDSLANVYATYLSKMKLCLIISISLFLMNLQEGISPRVRKISSLPSFNGSQQITSMPRLPRAVNAGKTATDFEAHG